MMGDMWIRNVAVFTEALGVENAPAIIELSNIPWPTDEMRDSFIKDLTGINMRANR
jgi:hypothetical protein